MWKPLQSSLNQPLQRGRLFAFVSSRALFLKASGDVLARAGRSFAFILPARWLGPDDLGFFAFLYAQATLLVFLTDFGIPLLVTRAASVGDQARIGSLLRLRGHWLCALAPIAAMIAFLTTGDVEGFWLGLLAFGAAGTATFGDALHGVLRARNRFGVEAALKLAGAAVTLATVAASSWRGLGCMGLAIGLFLGSAVGLVASLASLPDMGTLLRARDSVSASQIMRETMSGPVSVQAMWGQVHAHLDYFLLAALAEEAQVAYWAIALRIVSMASIVPVSVVSVSFPAVARMSVEGSPDLSKLVAGLVAGLAALGLVAGLCGRALTSLLVPLALGEQYAGAVPALDALLLMLGPWFASAALLQLLVAVRAEHGLYLLVPISACASIALSLALIPGGGALGAAHAKVLEGLVSAAVLVWLLGRALRARKCGVSKT